MASMGDFMEPDPLIRQIKDGGLLNKYLVAICAAAHLSKTGVKSDLQSRIIERIRHFVDTHDQEGFERIKSIINNPNISSPDSPYRGMAASSSPARTAPVITTPNSSLSASKNHSGYTNMGGGGRGEGYTPAAAYGQPRGLEFKPSPFFNLVEQIGATSICDIMQHHRHTAKLLIKPQTYPILQQVSKDPTLKVMVFCADGDKGQQEIAFPHQSEIKVNSNEIKANLRGLKNKPGSTRPVDITKDLRFHPSTYQNSVEMTYALTTKKFFLAVFVARTVPVTSLVEILRAGKRITERTVLDNMASKARDADIVATASVLSLKCPLSTLIIDLPCRSMSCKHNQCFDATSYLQLQEQAPTWSCPICYNPAPFETLAVDEYIRNILESTGKSVDQVILQPDGKWQLHAKKENISLPRSNGDSSDDEDDLVEVSKTGDIVSTRPAPVGVPSQRSISISSAAPTPTSAPAGAKRPIAAIIDLTSSGDEDEPPARTSKRQYTNGYGTSSSTANYHRPPPPFH